MKHDDDHLAVTLPAITPGSIQRVLRGKQLDFFTTAMFFIFIIGAIARILTLLYAPINLDELDNTFAARMILEHGIPIFPSGMVWPAGGLLTYLQAPFVGIFGELSVWSRVPGVICSIGSIPALYYIGKQFFSPTAGLIAALAWSLDPDAIYWGAIARQYSLHPLLLFMALYTCRNAAKKSCTGSSGLIAAFFIVLTIWVQPPTVLWLPAFLVAFLVWKEKGPLKPVIISASLCTAGVVATLALVYFGDPGLFQSKDGTRLIQTGHDFLSFLSNLVRYFPVFAAYPLRLVFSLFGLIGLFMISFLKKPNKAKEFIAVAAFILTSVFALGLFHYQQPGYGLALVGPLFVLGAGCLTLIDGRGYRRLFTAGIAVLAAVPILKGLVGPDQGDGQLEGYEYVHNHWRRGDAMLNANTSSKIFAGAEPHFYFLCANSCGLGLMKVGDRWVNRFLGSPQIENLDGVKSVLATHHRVWLVIKQSDYLDSDRTPPDIRNYLESNMTLLLMSRGTRVFLADSNKP